MRKKTVFTILLAMVIALSFAWTATAADEDACVDCGKCALRQIKCCTPGAQSVKTGYYFDYESGVGYCTGIPSPNYCKAIFDLCECDEPNKNFTSGSEIGVHMTILNAGVYFTDDPVDVTLFTDSDDACVGTPFYAGPFTPGTTTYYDRAGKVVTPMSLTDPDYYSTCVVPCLSYAMELVTDGFVKVTSAIVADQAKYWWVDIPAMVLNDSEIAGRAGETIRVEVCLQASGIGICRECNDICCCIIEVGTLCCDVYKTQQTCIYFPYVVTGLTSIGWQTGISVTNYDGTASMDLTLTLTDSTGAKFYYSKPGHTAATWSFFLDSILSGFSGTPAAGAAMLQINASEGWIDGYSFLTDGNFGGSTLARGCCILCK